MTTFTMGKDHIFGSDVPSSSSSSDESVEIQQKSNIIPQNYAHQRNGHLFENLVVLDHILETTPLETSGLLTGSVEDCMDACSGDELFLLPESVLTMDSASFREDVRSVAPSLIPKNHNNNNSNNALCNNFGSPHNSLDSTDSAKSLRLLEDSEGLRMARASQGCKTLWLCKWL